jgi:hypothetical protein
VIARRILKFSVTFLGMISLIVTGCSDVGTEPDVNVALISGTWRWVRSTGGIGGTTITPTPGVITKDVYAIHGTFSRFRNDTLIVSARFSFSTRDGRILMKLTDIRKYLGFPVSDPSYPFGVFDWLGEEWVTFEGDTLFLADNGYDLYSHMFLRLQE